MPPMKNRKCSCSKHFITFSLTRNQKKKTQPTTKQKTIFYFFLNFLIQHFLALCCLKHYPFTFQKVASNCIIQKEVSQPFTFFQKIVCCCFRVGKKTQDSCQSCASQQQGINPLDSVTKFCGCYNRTSQTSATTYNCSFLLI